MEANGVPGVVLPPDAYIIRNFRMLSLVFHMRLHGRLPASPSPKRAFVHIASPTPLSVDEPDSQIENGVADWTRTSMDILRGDAHHPFCHDDFCAEGLYPRINAASPLAFPRQMKGTMDGIQPDPILFYPMFICPPWPWYIGTLPTSWRSPLGSAVICLIWYPVRSQPSGRRPNRRIAGPACAEIEKRCWRPPRGNCFSDNFC